MVSGTAPENRRKPPNVGKGKPNPPTWLSKEAKAEWARIVPVLARADLLAKVDRALLSGWCATWATWTEAQRILDVEGPLVDGYRGSKVKNPAAQVARDQLQSLLSMSIRLGLSYADRARLAIPLLPDEDPNEDELDRLTGR